LRCVSKGGRESIRCVHPSRRIAEPVIGRAFARPGGDAPQGEVSILFTNWRASRSDAFQDSMRAKPVPGKELRHAMSFARAQPILRADDKTELGLEILREDSLFVKAGNAGDEQQVAGPRGV
jgi:hypothetical protein